MDLDFSDVIARLLPRLPLEALLVLNCDLADKPIGVRTLVLVSLGSAIRFPWRG